MKNVTENKTACRELSGVELDRVAGGTNAVLADIGRAVIIAVQMAEGKITTHAKTLN